MVSRKFQHGISRTQTSTLASHRTTQYLRSRITTNGTRRSGLSLRTMLVYAVSRRGISQSSTSDSRTLSLCRPRTRFSMYCTTYAYAVVYIRTAHSTSVHQIYSQVYSCLYFSAVKS